MTSIGFTGTRRGMTVSQWSIVQGIIAQYWHDDDNEWHDGDCFGADTQAHAAARFVIEDASTAATLHGHPCNLDSWRAHNEYDVTHEIKPPLARNRDIVDAAGVMIAAPGEYDEQVRGSGTWATIRYARRQGKPLYIVWPDGTETAENVEERGSTKG